MTPAPVSPLHAAVSLARFGASPQTPLRTAPFHRWTLPDGSVWSEFFRTSEGYLVRFPDKADFEISADGLRVSGRPAAACSDGTLEHLYLNQVIPLALSRQGHLVLHASAVDIGGQAVAFLGRTGRGKSTLAASFASSGDKLLTDDGLHISLQEGSPVAVPSHPSLRLWDDSQRALGGEALTRAEPLGFTSKARITGGAGLSFAEHAQPLSRIYLLGSADESAPDIAALRPVDAMMAMVSNSFLLDIAERDMLTGHFEHIAALAGQPIHFRLDYPRRYDALPAVRAAIKEHLWNLTK